MRFLFPPKAHPEDINPIMAMIAKMLFAGGVLCFAWSSFHLTKWGGSFDFKQTEGQVDTGLLRYVTTGVGNVSYSYVVDGETYLSQNIAFGGRPLGRVPEEGAVTVYYDPNDPGTAVLQRRPAEGVIIAFVFAVLSPFAARYVWRNYA